MTHSLKWGKRLTAAAGVTALVAAGFAGATTASAAVGKDDYKTALANLSSTASASVTFHKLTGQPKPSPAPTDKAEYNGQVKDIPAGATGIAGVQFRMVPIGCAASGTATTPLTLDAEPAWTHIQGLALDGAPTITDDVMTAANFTKTGDNKDSWVCNIVPGTDNANVVETGKTEATGTVVASNVAHYAYVVYEVDNDSVETKIDPFILTVPHAYTPTATEKANGAKAGWLYDINIYPKNVLKTETGGKEPKLATIRYVLPDGTVVTDTQAVAWELTLPVNQLEKGKTAYESLVLTDALPNTLGYVSVDGVKRIPQGKEAKDAVALAANEYTVTGCAPATAGGTCDPTAAPVAYASETSVGSTFIKFALTSDGLKNIKAGDKIVFNLNTTVRTANVTVSGVKNEAQYALNGGDPETINTFKGDGGDPEDSKLNYGTIDVDKYMKDADTTKLAGAKFDLYVASNDASAVAIPGVTGVNGIKLDTLTDTNSNPVQWVTEDTGKFAAPIKVYLGKGSDTAETFYLVETTAPDGYQLNTAEADNTYKIEFTAAGAEVVKVANVRKNIDTTAGLPITGAQGLMLLTLGGAAIVLVGVGSMMVIRRRQEQD